MEANEDGRIMMSMLLSGVFSSSYNPDPCFGDMLK
jgi:hypothetical protein